MPLFALSQSDGYELPSGAHDVRGWDVRTMVDDEKVGIVHDLLIDREARPRYLDVDLGLFRKHVLIPVGQARADPLARRVRVPGFTRDQVRALPAYHHELSQLTAEYEDGLIAAYSSAFAGEEYCPRPPYAGAVYGPSEIEDRVGPTMAPRLARLSTLTDYRIAPGEPDPRRWTVVVADGASIGRVDELIVDTRARKVRYLVCAVDEAALGLEPIQRHVLIPVGFARLDEDNRNVLVDRIDAAAVRRMPIYSGQEIEAALREEVLRPFEAPADDDRYRDDPRFDHRRFYGADG